MGAVPSGRTSGYVIMCMYVCVCVCVRTRMCVCVHVCVDASGCVHIVSVVVHYAD